MLTSRLHILLSFVFMVSLTTPAVVTLVIDDIDASVFLSLNDEEGEELNDVRELLEFDFYKDLPSNLSGIENTSVKISTVYIDTFEELHIENIPPPPELV